MRPPDPGLGDWGQQRREICPGCGHFRADHFERGQEAFLRGLAGEAPQGPCNASQECDCSAFGEMHQQTMR